MAAYRRNRQPIGVKKILEQAHLFRKEAYCTEWLKYKYLIAVDGNSFAIDNLAIEDMMAYFYHLLRAYEELQRF